jgi:hypothetical protein
MFTNNIEMDSLIKTSKWEPSGRTPWSGDTIIQNGKYQGKTFSEVATNHSDYIEYLREKGLRTEFKMLVKYHDILKEFDD